MPVRGSAQIAPGQGPAVELVQLPGGGNLFVPTAALRALRTDTNELGDLSLDPDGGLLVRQTNMPALENGRVPVSRIADTLTSKDLTGTTVTGDPAAQGVGELIVDVRGFSTVAIRKAAGSGTLVFEVSMTGATWDSLICARADATGSQNSTSGTTTNYETWEAAIPAGAMYIRARATVVAGSVTVRIGLSQAAYEPAMTAAISGQVSVAPSTSTANPTADGATTLALQSPGVMDFNGTNFDRHRSNGVPTTVAASAARTSTLSGSNIVTYNARNLLVFLDVTVASGTGGLTLRVEALDAVSGKYVTILQDAAPITAVGTYAFEVGPDVTPNQGQRAAAARLLARSVRVVVAHGDASSYTYAVGAQICL